VTSNSSQPYSVVAEAESDLRLLEELYCSHGDTVHYSENPAFFTGCEGSFLFNEQETPFLDLQM
jgi:hypothetical protein